MKTYPSVDVGEVVIRRGVPAAIVREASHRVAQSFDGLAAEDLILSSEIVLFGRPRSIDWVFGKVVDVGLVGQDLGGGGELRLGSPTIAIGFEENMALDNVYCGLSWTRTRGSGSVNIRRPCRLR